MLNASPTLFALPSHGNIISKNEGEPVWGTRQLESFDSINTLPQNRLQEFGARESAPSLQDKWRYSSQLILANRFRKRFTPEFLGANQRHASVIAKGRDIDIPQSIGFRGSFPRIIEKSWLNDALDDLAWCPNDALDEGFIEPSEIGLTKAKQILNKISTYILEQPEIYPMDEGGIAIDFRNRQLKSGLFILIEFDGSGALFYRSDKLRGRVRVNDAIDLIGEINVSMFRKLNIQ